MIHIMARYRIKKGASQEVNGIITEFVEQISAHETGTLFYQAFYYIDESHEYIHIMTFRDGFAQEVHRKSGYVKKFMAQLYPFCESEPEFIGLELVARNK